MVFPLFSEAQVMGPSNPGNEPQGQPIGGGAPIGSGLVILLGMGAIYGIGKSFTSDLADVSE